MSTKHSTPTAAQWYRPMRSRDPGEVHRVSTPLELLFDLCFVAAVARAGGGLESLVEHGDLWTGVTRYMLAFFTIWWAWMNFTWFASAFDTDDVPYRLIVLIQIAGSLVLAAGIGQLLAEGNLTTITWGYVLIRAAMVAQWIRAARTDPAQRSTALRYAGGILIVQIGWVTRLALPTPWQVNATLLLVIAELAVPAWAERRTRTTYHPAHVRERYGLFTVIVLGEAVTAAAGAVQTATQEGDHGAPLIVLAAAGTVILFSLWWLYFDQPTTGGLDTLRTALTWGYGHYVIFSSTAAVGTGLALCVAAATHSADGAHHLDATTAHAMVTAPVAVFLTALAALRGRKAFTRSTRTTITASLLGAALILAATWSAIAVQLTAAVLILLVAHLVTTARPAPAQRPAAGTEPTRGNGHHITRFSRTSMTHHPRGG